MSVLRQLFHSSAGAPLFFYGEFRPVIEKDGSVLIDEESGEEVLEFQNYLRYFFEGSDEEELIKEVSLIAERWKWTDQSVRELPTLIRRKYAEEIIAMYEREKEAMDKAKSASRNKRK